MFTAMRTCVTRPSQKAQPQWVGEVGGAAGGKIATGWIHTKKGITEGERRTRTSRQMSAESVQLALSSASR